MQIHHILTLNHIHNIQYMFNIQCIYTNNWLFYSSQNVIYVYIHSTYIKIHLFSSLNIQDKLLQNVMAKILTDQLFDHLTTTKYYGRDQVFDHQANIKFCMNKRCQPCYEQKRSWNILDQLVDLLFSAICPYKRTYCLVGLKHQMLIKGKTCTHTRE